MKDYEQKHKEDLEEAKSWLAIAKENSNKLAIQILENLFPELQESDDEKIRKGIIEYLEHSQFGKEHYLIDDDIVRRYIAWLEKQGKQMPSDKVEPKFKVKDWITNGEYTWKVTDIKPLDYILQSQNGDTVNDTISYVDEEFHLWTIQDAKDGDVLVASDESIFLYKGTIDCACKHYVALTTDGVIKFNEGLEHFWETSTAIHPATKAQQDLLFAKMKEAGYEWSDKDRKLIKIVK